MKIKGGIDRIIILLKDIFFPAYCLGCDKEGEFVCADCYKTLSHRGVFCCPVCHQENLDGSCCDWCKDKTVVDKHVAVLLYREENLIGKIMHSFKYQYTEDISSVFESLIKDFFGHYNIEIDYIVPVPLHKRRYVERGFNQAEKIAEIVSKELNKPLQNILRRKRHTKQQAKLSRNDRLENLKGAFELDNKANVDLKNKVVLLVDDVFTTGSTMGECALVLKNSGVREVVGFSVARG